MTTPDETLEALGNRVRLAEEYELERLQNAGHVRARLMTAQQPRVASEAWRLVAFASVGAVLGGLVIAVIGQYREQPLSFRLDTPSAPSQLGVPLHATTGTGAVIRFSDGSSIRMQEGAQTRVASVDERGARVLVDRGRIGVDVVHQAASRWKFEAGPFEVTVTGTRFEMSWEPASQAFELSMTEGAVVVSGCSLAGVGAVAGQSVRATCVQDHAELEFIAPGASSAINAQIPVPDPEPREVVSAPLLIPASPGAAAPAQTGQELANSPQDASATAESETALPTWQSLAAAGRYREAYELADRAGFEQECERAGASDLLALSEAALFSQRADRTRAALLKLRARFPGASHAATAAFRLGRLAFDTQGAYAEARQWFTTYLSEQPGGGFAREATGRLIEVEYRSGNLPSARNLAERYLQSWPNGPHAPLARSLAGD